MHHHWLVLFREDAATGTDALIVMSDVWWGKQLLLESGLEGQIPLPTVGWHGLFMLEIWTTTTKVEKYEYRALTKQELDAVMYGHQPDYATSAKGETNGD